MDTNHEFLFACFFGAAIAAGESPQILSRSLAHSLLTCCAYRVNHILLLLVHHAACDLRWVLHPQLTRNSEIEQVGFKAVGGLQSCVVKAGPSAN